jgi:uncharacterized membrane protein (DUF4010 family)
MAALLLLKRDEVTEPERRIIRRLAVQLLVLALLTQLVFPLLYDGLVARPTEARVWLSTTVTALRNLALLAFTIELVVQAWKFLGRADSSARQASLRRS